jgi:hypothetical protein
LQMSIVVLSLSQFATMLIPPSDYIHSRPNIPFLVLGVGDGVNAGRHGGRPFKQRYPVKSLRRSAKTRMNSTGYGKQL